MRGNRTWTAALAAFLLVLCIGSCIGGFLLVGVRSGRTLFGDTYEPITWQSGEWFERPLPVWIPARLRVVLYVPKVTLYGFEWAREIWL